MKFILGTKQEMTQVFDEEGRAYPATAVKVEPNTVTLVRENEKDRYKAIQVGAGKRREKNVNKAQRKSGLFARIREFKVDEVSQKVGDKIDVSVFEKGDKVNVSAVSKGKGFQGVVKRHGFHGGPRTHGQKHSERKPGSIGSTGPQKVLKGTRMAGRMGGNRVTVKNLPVLQVDAENNLLLIGGAIPGRRGTLVEIRSQK